MAKPDLKVVAADTAERAALAAAIAHEDAAAKSLAEAEAASENALEKLSVAFREQEHLELLHRDIACNASATPAHDHGRLIAALAGGSDVEAPAPPPDRLSEVSAALAACGEGNPQVAGGAENHRTGNRRATGHARIREARGCCGGDCGRCGECHRHKRHYRVDHSEPRPSLAAEQADAR
ncbi:MAG: hypothetical protein ACR65X_13020 [Methylocystis sp.]